MDSKPFIRSSNIWGRMVLSFLGPKVVLFYEIIGGVGGRGVIGLRKLSSWFLIVIILHFVN